MVAGKGLSKVKYFLTCLVLENVELSEGFLCENFYFQNRSRN